MKDTKLNIVYGNHSNTNHMIDLAEIASYAFKNASIIRSITCTKDPIKDQLNLIIEEFSDAEFCEKLVFIKKQHPKTKFALIITEIPTDFSYNAFNSEDYSISKYIHDSLVNQKVNTIKTLLISIYLKYLKKLHPFFKSNSIFYDYKKIKANLSFKILNKIYKIIFGKDIPYFFNLLHFRSDLVYFVIRFINTKQLIKLNLFDKIYIINDCSREITDLAFKCKSEEFPYYFEPKREDDKPEVFMFSGNINQERVDLIRKIEDYGLKVGCNPDFNNLGRKLLYDRSMFSIQISRYLNGNYSSPTRTINALMHGVIPIPLSKPLYSNMEQDLSLPLLTDALKILSETTNEDRMDVVRRLYLSHMNKISDAVKTINKRSILKINADLNDIYS